MNDQVAIGDLHESWDEHISYKVDNVEFMKTYYMYRDLLE
jgi:hypothetical protein